MNIAGISKHGSCCMEGGNGRSCRAESVVMSEIGWGGGRQCTCSCSY